MGATGLEPATSGVTGRADGHDAGRRSTPLGALGRMAAEIAVDRAAFRRRSSEKRMGRLGHEWGTVPPVGGVRFGHLDGAC